LVGPIAAQKKSGFCPHWQRSAGAQSILKGKHWCRIMVEINSPYEYQVGGSLPIAANSYVIRQADTDFYQRLKAGQLCYVLNARQMGKSSLRVRTIQRLQAEGFVCACIDLTGIGKEAVTPEKWYAGIVNALVSSCHLSDRIQWRDWWRERRDVLSPVQRLSGFIDEVLLVEVPQNIIVFIDEIDRVLSQTFALDDFFALIRYFYNQRADQPAYRRLTFALLGVATPADLIADKTQTPFNIGQAIALSGFQRTEVQPLINGLVGKVADPEAAISEILAWTGGQPFLTQKLCQILTNTDHLSNNPATNPATNPVIADANSSSVYLSVAELVHARIITNWESQDEPEHLRTIRDRILGNHPQTGQLLGLYQQILTQGEITADGSLAQTELRLSGLVVQRQGQLRVYNPIYQQVFDRVWVDHQLAKLRPYAETFNAWIASEGQDHSGSCADKRCKRHCNGLAISI
jgi:AAA-like domain